MRVGRGHAGRLSRRDALATVTDTDRRLLTLLAEQRVLTQTQLERLLADTPPRTLRYRSERLTRLGLVGRSRPYRDKGSAPFHYWPTRASDAFVRGEPIPRGGERAEPNPQFLHHAERLSELYVLLAAEAPTVGLHLHEFRREGDARELFRADGRERALAPDALIHLRDDTGRSLLAFVELDLGTMSHARLKTKAAGYAAYAAQAAWTESHPFCPCLLFLTTTEARAVAFLKLLNGLLDKHRCSSTSYYGGRGGNLAWFAAGACAHAREPERALAEACWDDLRQAGGGLTVTDCLNRSRVAYDTTRAKQQAEQRARDEQRKRLRANPEARRAHLRDKHLRFQGEHLNQFGETAATALHLLLTSTEPMNDVERDAFAAIGRQLSDDPLEAEAAPHPVAPTWTDTEAVASLVETYRRHQRAHVDELARRYGEGPSLRRDRELLADGGLLGRYSCDSLEETARRDQEIRREQERLRRVYLDRREQEARRRRHEAGLAARLTQGRSAVYALVDRDLLRICRYCNEIAYPPQPERERHRSIVVQTARQPSRCHFCRGSDLAAWDPAYQSELEYGPGTRLLGSDLTSGGINGLIDDNDNRKGRP